MIICTKTFTRPTSTIQWKIFVGQGIFDQAFETHFADTYRITGLCSYENWAETPDELTLTYIMHWSSQEDFDTYAADSVILPYWDARDQYFASCGITVSQTVEPS